MCTQDHDIVNALLLLLLLLLWIFYHFSDLVCNIKNKSMSKPVI